MMALIGQSEQAGKLEQPLAYSTFPAFSKPRICGMFPSTKMRKTKHPPLIVIWETAPNPKPDAVDKAFAMLFKPGDCGPKRPRVDKPCVYANVPNDSKN